MEKNIIGVKNGLKMTNHGVTLSTVEYGVIIQKSIINIALKMKLKIMLKIMNQKEKKKSEIGKFCKINNECISNNCENNHCVESISKK